MLPATEPIFPCREFNPACHTDYQSVVNTKIAKARNLQGFMNVADLKGNDSLSEFRKVQICVKFVITDSYE